MERIVNKSLEKDRNLRYQHAADMRADLQRLKLRHRHRAGGVAARSGTVAAVRSAFRSDRASAGIRVFGGSGPARRPRGAGG